MRTLSIRSWLFIGMGVFIASASLFYQFADVLDQRAHRPSMQQQAALDTAQRAIAGSADRWADPAWQATLRGDLAASGLRVVIRDASGAEIARVGKVGRDEQASRQAVIVADGRERGTADLFTPQRGTPPLPLTAGAAILLVTLFVRWQMARPLEAMGRAARRIAGGDLDFAIPPSRVREVASVGAAFEAMGAGLRAALRRQAALEEERRFFVGAIAHDLRTPLFSLRGHLEGLAQGVAATPEQIARYVAVCREQSEQLDRLVSDLFAYTRAEQLEQAPQTAPLDIGPLLAHAVQSQQPGAQEKQISLTVMGPDAPCVVAADAALLRRAVGNILDNAIRYTPSGGTVAVAWHAEAGRVTFTVADSGPGIAAADLPHLFDPLYRGEASRNRATGGAGLGLAIARRILRAHGGDLTAANRPTGGAILTGRLPAATPTDATEEAAHGSPRALAAV